MSIDVNQLRELVIRPTLYAIGLYTDNAEEMLIATAAHESHLGTYLKQVEGPANGIYQMQEPTYNALWQKYIAISPSFRAKVNLYLGYSGKPPFARLISDMTLATLMARLYYWDIKKPLPSKFDVAAMAQYWKDNYNRMGLGNTDDFINNYNRLVLGKK